MEGFVEAGGSSPSPLPCSELLEDLENSSSAGGIAECFVQRVSGGVGGSRSWMGPL